MSNFLLLRTHTHKIAEIEAECAQFGRKDPNIIHEKGIMWSQICWCHATRLDGVKVVCLPGQRCVKYATAEDKLCRSKQWFIEFDLCARVVWPATCLSYSPRESVWIIPMFFHFWEQQFFSLMHPKFGAKNRRIYTYCTEAPCFTAAQAPSRRPTSNIVSTR